jgi:hypothetical protein
MIVVTAVVATTASDYAPNLLTNKLADTGYIVG